MTNIKFKRYKDGSIVFFQGKTYLMVDRPIEIEKTMQSYFNRSANPRYIEQIVNRIAREIAGFKKRALAEGDPFPFSDKAIADFEIAFSESVQNAILHAPDGHRRHVSINVMYVPYAYIFVGVTDTTGPISFEQWKLSLRDEQNGVHLGTSKRGLFIMTALGSYVMYYPGEPEKEIATILVATPNGTGGTA